MWKHHHPSGSTPSPSALLGSFLVHGTDPKSHKEPDDFLFHGTRVTLFLEFAMRFPFRAGSELLEQVWVGSGYHFRSRGHVGLKTYLQLPRLNRDFRFMIELGGR